MRSLRDLEQVLAVLSDDSLRFPAEIRDDLVRIIENGLIPRITGVPGPLNVVFVGPTGSGKSTLINSVAGRMVSSPGVLRPTTTRPLIYSQADTDTGFANSSVPYDHVSGSSPILDSISLIDTPDVDSTNLENRRRALDAVSRADVVVFVTSALRYADLVPWELLLAVSERGIPVIFVLNRISSSNAGVVTDFRRRARNAGMSFRVIRIEEHHLTTGEMLPPASVRDLRRAILSACSDAGTQDRYMSSGFNYVSGKLVAMREWLLAEARATPQGAIQPWLSYAPIEDLVTAWLGDPGVGGVSRWSGKEVWRSRYRMVLDEIRVTLVGVLENDLRTAGLVGGGVVIDLSDTPDRASLDELDRLVDRWLESIGPSGEIDQLRYRPAKKKVLNAIDSVSLLFTPGEAKMSSFAVDDSVDRLRSDIDAFFSEASHRAQISDGRRAEIAAVDSLIEMFDRRSAGLFAANA